MKKKKIRYPRYPCPAFSSRPVNFLVSNNSQNVPGCAAAGWLPMQNPVRHQPHEDGNMLNSKAIFFTIVREFTIPCNASSENSIISFYLSENKYVIPTLPKKYFRLPFQRN